MKLGEVNIAEIQQRIVKRMENLKNISKRKEELKIIENESKIYELCPFTILSYQISKIGDIQHYGVYIGWGLICEIGINPMSYWCYKAKDLDFNMNFEKVDDIDYNKYTIIKYDDDDFIPELDTSDKRTLYHVKDEAQNKISKI